MIPVMCVVQEGQLAPQVERVLKAEVKDFIQRAFASRADIDWIVVPKDCGFTAARPSTAVIVSLCANKPLDPTERISLLKELSEICMRNAERSADEILTSIRDPHQLKGS
jgi:hypothetical protein